MNCTVFRSVNIAVSWLSGGHGYRQLIVFVVDCKMIELFRLRRIKRDLPGNMIALPVKLGCINHFCVDAFARDCPCR